MNLLSTSTRFPLMNFLITLLFYEFLYTGRLLTFSSIISLKRFEKFFISAFIMYAFRIERSQTLCTICSLTYTSRYVMNSYTLILQFSHDGEKKYTFKIQLLYISKITQTQKSALYWIKEKYELLREILSQRCRPYYWPSPKVKYQCR